MGSKDWQDVNAIYQIYPRSFQDSNDDGIGDLRGVINRLDYIHGHKDSLGIDAIWFSPMYPSPMADMGYDVSDYRGVDPLFGTLDDLKELIEICHERGVNVMLDFVPNHTSEEHPWFIESRSSRTNDKRDYYVWHDGKPDGTPPNNWQSLFGGPAWEWDEGRQQYYLHTFLKEQPDLNWDNPMVREEMKEVIRYWMELGVDGIRADAVRFISKDPTFHDNRKVRAHKRKPHVDEDFAEATGKYSEFGPNLFSYLRELTDVISEFDDRIIIFEDYPSGHYSTEEQYMGFYSVDPRVSMPFNFEGIWTEFSAEAFRRFITEFQGMLDPSRHRPVYCFGNHDQWRMVSRFGGEDQARIITMLQLTLPGLPVIYYGDELGMPNTPIKPDEIQDASAFTSGDLSVSRDPERTPMQWESGQSAGFSNSKPWLPISPSVRYYNVEKELHEPDSMLSLYRRLLRLRAKHSILRSGTFETFGEADKEVFIYSRRSGDEHVFVVLNFGGRTRNIKLPHKVRILCSTHPVDYPEATSDGEVTLRAYEGILAECSKHPLTD